MCNCGLVAHQVTNVIFVASGVTGVGGWGCEGRRGWGDEQSVGNAGVQEGGVCDGVKEGMGAVMAGCM